MTMVIAQHCGLLPCGWTGVWLFYTISGFVICRTLLMEQPAPFLGRYRRFVARRFFRIVPVYVLYILLSMGIMAAAGRYGSLRDVPFLLTFTYNWQMIFGIWKVHDAFAAFGHLWTLSVEEQFYLCFPLLLLLLPRRAFLRVAVLLVLMGPLIRFLFSEWIATLPAGHNGNWAAYAIYAGSFTQFDGFLIGALMAISEPELRRSRLALQLPIGAALAAVLYVGAYVFVNHAHGATGIDIIRNVISGTLYGQHREVFVYSVVDLVAASLVLFVIRGRRGVQFLAGPGFSMVGRISYGGYLFHALVLFLAWMALGRSVAVLPIPDRIACFMAVWATTVIIAYVSFRWFETRIISWSRRAARRVPGTRDIPKTARNQGGEQMAFGGGDGDTGFDIPGSVSMTVQDDACAGL